MSRDVRTPRDAFLAEELALGARAEGIDAAYGSHDLRRASEQRIDALDLSAAELDCVQPSTMRKRRLLEHARLLTMAPEIAVFFGVSEESARAHAERLLRTEGWQQVVRGLSWLPFEPSAGMCTGFMRTDAAFEMPSHQHAATEQVLVLAGRLRSHDGSTIGPGETLLFQGGTAHWFGVDACPEILVAVRVR